MIDAAAGFEVRIHPHGSGDCYSEYAPVERTQLKISPDRNAVFVAPVLNERFSIEVILHPTFDFMRQDWVRVLCDIGSTVPEQEVFFRNPDRGTIANMTARSQQHTFEIIHHSLHEKRVVSAMAWSATKHGRSITLETEGLRPLEFCGKIIINVVRGSEAMGPPIKPPLTPKSARRATTVGGPIKMVKFDQFMARKERQTIGIKLTALSEVPTNASLRPQHFEPNQASNKVRFDYYYASKDYLELHDIIADISKPRSLVASAERASKSRGLSPKSAAVAPITRKVTQSASDINPIAKKPLSLEKPTQASSSVPTTPQKCAPLALTSSPAQRTPTTPSSAKRSFSQMSTPTHLLKRTSLGKTRGESEEGNEESPTKTRKLQHEGKLPSRPNAASPSTHRRCSATDAMDVDGIPSGYYKEIRLMEIEMARLDLDIEAKKLVDPDPCGVLELRNQRLNLELQMYKRKLYRIARA